MKATDETFILGAGFSRWISSNMPLMEDLLRQVRSNTELSKEIDRNGLSSLLNLQSGFEALISHLANQYPWKSKAESLYEQALYEKCVDFLLDILEKSQSAVDMNTLSASAKQLFGYFNDRKSTVITFNYDSLLELGLTSGRNVSLYSLWKLPLINIMSRGETTYGTYAGGGQWDPSISNPEDYPTVVKLHGSHNWLHSGPSSTPTDQVYFAYPGNTTPRGDVNSKGLRPLIIPPSIEKSAFFHHSLVSISWEAARSAIESAARVFIVGYSLPISDTYVELLLARALNEHAKLFVVNNDESADFKTKMEHYFSDKNVELDLTLLGPDAIDMMVQKITSNSP